MVHQKAENWPMWGFYGKETCFPAARNKETGSRRLHEGRQHSARNPKPIKSNIPDEGSGICTRLY